MKVLCDAVFATPSAGKTDDRVLLRGIPSRGYIGFLTLFEAYGYFKVSSGWLKHEGPIMGKE